MKTFKNELGVFLLSAFVAFFSLMLLVYHLQGSMEVDKRCAIFCNHNAIQQVDLSKQEQKYMMMAPAIAGGIFGSKLLSLVNWVDIAFLMILWGSGIFFTKSAGDLVERLCKKAKK